MATSIPPLSTVIGKTSALDLGEHSQLNPKAPAQLLSRQLSQPDCFSCSSNSGALDESEHCKDSDMGHVESHEFAWYRVMPARHGRRRRLQRIKGGDITLESIYDCPRIYRCSVGHRSDGQRPPTGLNDLVDDDEWSLLLRKFQACRAYLVAQLAETHLALCKNNKTTVGAHLGPIFISGLLAQLADALDQLPCSPVPLAGVDILCLGLGNPAVEASSLKQLALLDLLIEQEPRLNRAGARLYDPVFRRTARRLIEYLGMEASLLMVLSKNEEARYQLPDGRPHFVFMPHCAVALLNNFLFANWYPDRLAGIVFYVNSWPHLRAQLDLEPSGYVATQLAYLTALLPALVCFPSPSTWCPANCADLSTNSFAFKPHSEIQDYGM